MDKRVHLFLLAGFDAVNISVLKSYSEDDLVSVVIHYYDIPFLNEEFKKDLFNL